MASLPWACFPNCQKGSTDLKGPPRLPPASGSLPFGLKGHLSLWVLRPPPSPKNSWLTELSRPRAARCERASRPVPSHPTYWPHCFSSGGALPRPRCQALPSFPQGTSTTARWTATSSCWPAFRCSRPSCSHGSLVAMRGPLPAQLPKAIPAGTGADRPPSPPSSFPPSEIRQQESRLGFSSQFILYPTLGCNGSHK